MRAESGRLTKSPWLALRAPCAVISPRRIESATPFANSGRATRTRPAGGQSGFTLLEILLVLGVLTVFLGIAWPSVTGAYRRYAFSDRLEDVRSAFAGSRLTAIDAGLIYQFRYEPGGRNYVLVPYELPIGSPTDNSTAASVGKQVSGELHETMQFETTSSFAGVEKLSPDMLSGLSNAGKLQSVDWGPAILFYPDGTSVDATFDVVDEQKRRGRLTVRGLTGAVTLSRPEASDE